MTRRFLFFILEMIVIGLAFLSNNMAGNHWGTGEYAALFLAVFFFGTLANWVLSEELGYY